MFGCTFIGEPADSLNDGTYQNTNLENPCIWCLNDCEHLSIPDVNVFISHRIDADAVLEQQADGFEHTQQINQGDKMEQVPTLIFGHANKDFLTKRVSKACNS